MFHEAYTKMICRLMILLVFAGVLLAACSNSGPCNDEMLKRFKKSVVAELTWATAMSEGVAKDPRWEITPRGSGCVVGVSAEVNGVRVAPLQWFIDPETEIFAADSQLAKYLTSTTGVPSPPDNKLPK